MKNTTQQPPPTPPPSFSRLFAAVDACAILADRVCFANLGLGWMLEQFCSGEMLRLGRGGGHGGQAVETGEPTKEWCRWK